ncbi:MAG: rhomboid family intramembrane serine protease [Gammaproteobacteria bacterium]|nr:MAG: rhomboid family intramembrane serine protease [Gammaproteobacteria bacterium]
MNRIPSDATSSSTTPVVRILLALNIALFLVELLRPEALLGRFALWPLGVDGGTASFGMQPTFEPWQLLSYAFLHGGWMHLLLNMYALWLFGVPMERTWGSFRFLVFYLVCVVGAGLTQLLATLHSAEAYPTIGASGGVFGILLAFGMTYPNVRLMLLFPPMVLRAKWFVILYGAVELVFGITGTQAGVAHFAHLGGMLFGYLLIRYWRSGSRA